MAKVYALFVGIDDYPAGRWPKLGGCLNDIEEARRWLRERLDAPPAVRVLTDREATVAAVTGAIVRHLGKAGPGDRALLWFSGHGTEYDVSSQAERLVEATGKCQALVCSDGPLPDKRLGALLDGIAARGAHVSAVLDCCFSGGATRDPQDGLRYAPPLPEWSALPEHAPPVPSEHAPPPSPGHAPPGARDTAGPDRGPRHVLLAGCRLDQRAYERLYAGRRHGVFTHALLGALRAAPPGATYREVLAATNARVQADERLQHPVLAPADPGGIADTPVLGGAVRPPAPHLLRYGADGWEVDCGGVHGLREGADTARGTAFAVTGDHGGPVVHAREVHPTRTLVAPDGWAPDRAHLPRRAGVAGPAAARGTPGGPRREGRRPRARHRRAGRPALAAPAPRRQRPPGRAAPRRHRRRPGARPPPRRLARRRPPAAHRARRRPARRPLPRPPRALAPAVHPGQPGVAARGPGARRDRPLGALGQARQVLRRPRRDR